MDFPFWNKIVVNIPQLTKLMIPYFGLSFRKILIIFFTGLLMAIAVPRGLAQNTGFHLNAFSETSSQQLLAQASQPASPDTITKTQTSSNIKPANVTLDGEVLFTVKSTLGEVSPKERARTINSKLLRIAQDDAIAINSIRVVGIKNLTDWRLIQAGDILITVLTPDDVKDLNQSLPQVAEEYVKKIQIAVQNYREARTQENLVKGIIQAIIVTMFVSVLLYVINRFLPTDITNFSAAIRDRQQPLLLKTTVTLGYDLPWRKVHETLIRRK
jgi:hypothetical protein